MEEPAPRVVCAPDAFAGSLSASDAAAALTAGIRRSRPDAVVDLAPMADGGEGTVAAALAGGFRPVLAEVPGPVGDPVTATIAIRGGTAVVELADACGRQHLPGGRLRPLEASSRGVGVAAGVALDLGCTEIVLGVGGSASTDAGLGALAGLGARALDADGREVPPGAQGLSRVERIDLAGMHPRAATVRWRIATDVDNPLLGPQGAVAVFGAQKGITPEQAPAVEAGLAHVARVLAREARARDGDGVGAGRQGGRAERGRAERDEVAGAAVWETPGAGAGGGLPTGLLALLPAVVVSGAQFVLELIDLERRLTGAALAVTGEGSFDHQTPRGKGPAAVLAAAARAGVPAVVVAGRITLDADRLCELGVAHSWSLLDRVADPETALTDAAGLLADVGSEIGQWLAR
jgi:glycerate kinase